MTWLQEARHRFHLQTPEGLTPGGYDTVQTVPGSIRMANASEGLRFGGQLAVGSFVVQIRHRADVKAEWRLQDADDGRAFQIVGYGDPDGARQWLTIYAVELQ